MENWDLDETDRGSAPAWDQDDPDLSFLFVTYAHSFLPMWETILPGLFISLVATLLAYTSIKQLLVSWGNILPSSLVARRIGQMLADLNPSSECWTDDEWKAIKNKIMDQMDATLSDSQQNAFIMTFNIVTGKSILRPIPPGITAGELVQMFDDEERKTEAGQI